MENAFLAVFFAMAIGSASAWAEEKNYLLPKNLICPQVTDQGVTAETLSLTPDFIRYTVSESELRGDPAAALGAKQWRTGEFGPKEATITRNTEGELEMVFAYSNCDGSGSYRFPLLNVLREEGKERLNRIRGRASAEVRGDGIDVDVICAGVY